jgi:hypothetical protein
MATHPAFVVTSWDAPSWAEESVIDEEAVIHSLRLGATLDLSGHEMTIEVVQRDELSVAANAVSITRRPAYLRVAGELIPGEQASYFARKLMRASELLEEHQDVQQADLDSAEGLASDLIAS